MSAETAAFLATFLKDQPQDHLLVLASAKQGEKGRKYVRLPLDPTRAAAWAEFESAAGRDVYFKTALLQPEQVRMVKEAFQRQAWWLWSDLDYAPLERLPLQPNLLVESSPGRHQGLWRLAEPWPIEEAEAYSKALAYTVSADPSGWDIGQELRIPGTRNYKYESAPEVRVLRATGSPFVTREMLEGLGIRPAKVTRLLVDGEASEVPPPWDGPIPYFASEDPVGDRSGLLWRVLSQLRDGGWSQEDAFRIAWWSPANKYREDGRTPRDLWRDVVKCWSLGSTTLTVTPPSTGLEIAPTESRFMETKKRSSISWPLLCEQAISTFRGPTLISEEGIALAFLSAYSAGFPNIRIQGTNLGLWTLLLAQQASGKSTLVQGLSAQVAQANPSLQLVTSGSPEGIMQAAATGDTFLAFEEYSEQMKMMAKADGYAFTVKEVYSRMFDGAPFGHATRRNAISVAKVFVVMMAATNVDTWRKYGDPEDIANGYLSRFVVVADDLMERELDRSHYAEDLFYLGQLMWERYSHAATVSDAYLSHMTPASGLEIQPMYRGIEMAAGDLLLIEYQRRLEEHWQRPSSLDVIVEDTGRVIPPGRTLTKTRKIAALLELSEERPQITGTQLWVRESNTRRAIELTDLSMQWAERAIGWISQSLDKENVDRIIRVLERAEGKWLRPWDIAVKIRGLNAGQVKGMLKMMQESGMVERSVQQRPNGQASELWRLSR